MKEEQAKNERQRESEIAALIEENDQLKYGKDDLQRELDHKLKDGILVNKVLKP